MELAAAARPGQWPTEANGRRPRRPASRLGDRVAAAVVAKRAPAAENAERLALRRRGRGQSAEKKGKVGAAHGLIISMACGGIGNENPV